MNPAPPGARVDPGRRTERDHEPGDRIRPERREDPADGRIDGLHFDDGDRS
jgi:hypothetical protein